MPMDSLQNKQFQLEQLMPLIREALAEGKTVRFSPRGTSMLPMLRQGQDSVLLSPAPEKLKKYDIPLYQRQDGQYVLHRIVRAGETYTCIGDNQLTPEAGVKREQILAVVTAFTRGDRQIPVTDLRYGLYCRLWHYTRVPRYLLRVLKKKLAGCIMKKSIGE